MALVRGVCRGFLRMGKSGWGTRNLSKSKTKRQNLTHRYQKNGYYKGTGARIVGKLGNRGNFIPDPEKHLEIVMPDLEGFTLKPYVAASVSEKGPGVIGSG